MALLLGIDTGGTFTDAVLLDNSPGAENALVAKAKALTTRRDLSVGISGAVKAVLEQNTIDPTAIGLVSLSTTLATNALVEGHGNRVTLISIGFASQDLEKAGLREALSGDPVVFLEGGHTTHGHEAHPLNLEPLEEQLEILATKVSGFAVAGYFAVRNPAHELAVRDLVLGKTGLAVTCSHELSARLNGPKRALTTVLNARLVPMITRLIAATRKTLEQHKITAPLMVVRGDGALVSADFASRRPIETILSGPAASLVGARHLTKTNSALVCDIGGTTSDVAVLENGKPQLDPDGAMVGGFRTMVEAVAMKTFGLGGDSEVNIEPGIMNPEILIGPGRLVPVSLLAQSHGSIVHDALDAQLKSIVNGRHDARFAFKSSSGTIAGLSASEKRLMDRLSEVPVALEGFLEGNAALATLKRLVGKGLVQIAGLTPSDAMHALGHHCAWDGEAALKAIQLFARKRDGAGTALADNPEDLAERIVRQVQHRSAEVVLETAFDGDARDGKSLVSHELVQANLKARSSPNPSRSIAQLDIKLDRPLVGLGASAHQYHPPAAKLLGIEAIVPDHADVSNAIGAVVGQVSMQSQVTLSQPSKGQFWLSGVETPIGDEEEAFSAAREKARSTALELAQQAGATDVEISLSEQTKRAEIEGQDMLIEATVKAVATGRPPIAGS